MSENPPSLPPPGQPNDRLASQRAARAPTKAEERYNRIADTVGLVPNVRKKDNLLQGLCVLVFIIIGMTAAWFWDGAPIRDTVGDSWQIRLFLGALAGLVIGTVLSGLVIMVLGWFRSAES